MNLNEETVYYCDKCESEDVEVRQKIPQKKVIKKPMSQMEHPNQVMNVPLVMHITQYESHCKACGHTEDILQPMVPIMENPSPPFAPFVPNDYYQIWCNSTTKQEGDDYYNGEAKC